MTEEGTNLSTRKQRIVFLFLLALGVSVLLFWMIRGLLLALLLAAVLAAMVHPFYRWLLSLLHGRAGIASGVTIVLLLLLVVIPMLLFLGILVDQSVSVGKSAADWAEQQVEHPELLQQKIDEYPQLKRLLPHQDEIVAKASQLVAAVGSFAAETVASGIRVTAQFFLMLFVMLFAMFHFLIGGRTILDTALRYTPLSADDKSRLLGRFASVGRATVKSMLIIGIVQGGLAGLSFYVAGIEGAVFWGAVMTVLSIVPAVGTALVWVPAVIFLALDGQVEAAVGVGIWCAIVVGTADNVLQPLLVGKDTQMPDLLVMLTTLGGLALFGFAGLLVGPIIGALFMTVWQRWGTATDEARGRTAVVVATGGDQKAGQGGE